MAERRVPVVYKDNRRLIKFRDLSSVEGITDDIVRRLEITDDIKLFGKRSQSDEYFDIIDDEDLEGLEDMEGLELLAKSVSDTDGGTQDDTCSFSKHAFASRNDDDGFFKTNPGYRMPDGERPPEYAQSIPPASSHSQLKIIFGDKTKIVAIQPDIEAIRNIIASRFKYYGDFQLQVKDASRTMIDIDDDDDVDHNMALMHTVWVKDTTALEIYKQQKSTTVAIGKETYSLSEIPSYDREIVKNARKILRNEMGIDQIASTLSDIKVYLLVAYYASMENKTLHFKAQNMQLDIEKMCQDCDVNMLKIILKVRDTLNGLQCGFAYFIEGFEDFGLEQLGEAAGIAIELQENAERMIGTIEKRMSAIQGEGKALQRCNDREAVAKKMEGREKAKQKILDARSREVSESQARILGFENQERSAQQAANDYHQADSGIGFGFKKFFTLGFHQGNKDCAENQKQVAKEMREKQEKERTRLRQLKDEELQVKRDLDEFILKMNNAKPMELSEDAILAAQHCLKNIESFAQTFSTFWGKYEVEFESIGNKGFIQQLTQLGDPQKRGEFWKSNAFKLPAMNCIARLVAILAMCEDFQKTLGIILKDIHFCIRDNPTREEAKEKLPQLQADMKKNRGEAPKPGPID